MPSLETLNIRQEGDKYIKSCFLLDLARTELCIEEEKEILERLGGDRDDIIPCETTYHTLEKQHFIARIDGVNYFVGTFPEMYHYGMIDNYGDLLLFRIDEIRKVEDEIVMTKTEHSDDLRAKICKAIDKFETRIRHDLADHLKDEESYSGG